MLILKSLLIGIAISGLIACLNRLFAKICPTCGKWEVNTAVKVCGNCGKPVIPKK